jgi:hypothetical protein
MGVKVEGRSVRLGKVEVKVIEIKLKRTIEKRLTYDHMLID